MRPKKTEHYLISSLKGSITQVLLDVAAIMYIFNPLPKASRKTPMPMKQTIAVITCFILTALCVNAFSMDDARRQQLLGRLKKANDIEKIDIYNQLSRAFVYTNPDSTIFYADKALKLAKQLKDGKGQAEAFNNLGMGYYFRNDYDQLRDYYKKSLEAYHKLGDERNISVLSSTYYRLAQSEKALANYQRSLKIYQHDKKYAKQVETLRNIGDVYKNIGDYPNALDQYTQAASILNQQAEAIADPHLIETEMAQLLSRIGEIYLYRAQYAESLSFFKELEALSRKNSDWQTLAASLNNIASAYFFMARRDSAQWFYKQALDLQQSQNDYYGAAMSLMNIGKIEADFKHYLKALDSHRKSIRLAEIDGAKDVIRENYLEMSRLYASMGNYAEAYRYHNLFSDLAGVMTLEENVSQFINTLAIHDLEQRNREKQILQAKNENYRLKLEKEALIRWRLSFALIIVLIGVLAWFSIYRYLVKRNENITLEARISEALKKQEEQQQIIVHQSSLTSLGELAAGIAHEINQPMQNISLSAEGMALELEEPMPDVSYLKQSVAEVFEDIGRVRDIVDHIRLFSSGQKDGVWEPFDVSECVRSALAMTGRQLANRQIHLSLDLANGIRVMGNPHKLEQVVYNLLNNARDAVEEQHSKHPTHPMNISIITNTGGGKAILQVSDNGTGIPSHKLTDVFLPFYTTKQLGKGTGLGLSISHSLVKEMGGNIEAASELGNGTVMKVTLPLINE